jgi:hypothetical protein
MKYKKGDELTYKGKYAVIVNVNNYKENAQQYDYEIIYDKSEDETDIIWVYEFELESKEQKKEMKRPERYNKRTINGLDARDMIKELNLNFNEGNILKYLLRDKNQDIQDLEKIINYAQHEIEYLKKQNQQPERNENGVIEAVVW